MDTQSVGLAIFQLFFTMAMVLFLGSAISRLLGGDVRPPRRRELREEAERRAEALLQEILTPEEYGQLVKRGYLEVRSPRWPQRTYRIPRRQGQVHVYERGVPIMALCVQSLEPIPDADAVLMHKLMIEGNEQEYLRTANRFRPPFRAFISPFW
jgi:hypothetical protein